MRSVLFCAGNGETGIQLDPETYFSCFSSGLLTLQENGHVVDLEVELAAECRFRRLDVVLDELDAAHAKGHRALVTR